MCAGESLDAGGVKRMLLSFEKKVLKNQEMRIKFPDLPEKFMESELELNDEVQKLHIVATVPEHYLILVETNAIQTLVGLLSHDNSDVSIAVIDLLQELTDGEEEVEALIDALLSEQVLADMFACMYMYVHVGSSGQLMFRCSCASVFFCLLTCISH